MTTLVKFCPGCRVECVPADLCACCRGESHYPAGFTAVHYEMPGTAVCGHCGRRRKGYGFVDGVDLCHTGTLPPDAEPADCYRLVEVYLHRTDGSCCQNRPTPPWRGDDIPGDFYGCSRACLKRGKHTLKWGDCEYGVRPEPRLGFFRTATNQDGEFYGYEAEMPVTALLPWASVLTVDERHQMLEEATDSSEPAGVIERWRQCAAAKVTCERAREDLSASMIALADKLEQWVARQAGEGEGDDA